MRRLIYEREWDYDHRHGVGMLGINDGNNAVVLSDGLRAH